MSKEQEIQDILKNVPDTTTMVKKFISFLEAKNKETINIDLYLESFKTLYNERPYYDDVKESILTKIEILGMDAGHAEEML